MPTYRVYTVKMTGQETKDRTYTIEAENIHKAEIIARKRLANSLGLSSTRSISASAWRI